MRAGETIDEVFPNWIEQSHLDQNYYCPFNLNIPIELPRRENNAHEYAIDPPLSECGMAMSQIVARQLRKKRINLRYIFSSPALACIQTATQLAKILRKTGIICVEGGISGDAESMNVSMSLESLLKQHYPIDITYKPILNKLPNEDFEEIIERIVGIFKELSSKGTPSLFVCDTLAMYAICTATERQFRPRGIIRDTYIKQAFPAASIMTIRRHKIDEQTGFELLPDFLSPITHIAGCTRINPTYLHNDENEDIVRQ
uniref:Ubiquitin-associated and SH3 domain-containing protein A n=1 Tax=Ascaris suum TaxID=6253 RepID=F1LBS3_ASCSU